METSLQKNDHHTLSDGVMGISGITHIQLFHVIPPEYKKIKQEKSHKEIAALW